MNEDAHGTPLPDPADAAPRQRDLLDLFGRVADQPASEHERFIAEHCGDDAELAQRLRALLAHDARPSTALEDITSEVVTGVLRQVTPITAHEGQPVGAWRIERLIGSGGMGQVYLAQRRDGDVDQKVAIKFVRPDRLDSKVFERFSRERRVLASLQHPGISSFIDAGTLADGTPYVAMEYVEGEPLLDYCDRRLLGIRERVLLLRKILDAVAHAHDKLIVHRDIKGSNVLVTPEGEAKLLDFGIAKSLTEVDYTLTATSERFLTPINASPELLHGEPTGIGCDIYALGVLAYELLAGRPPLDFEGLRGAQVEQMILTVPPPPMSQVSAIDAETARQRGLDNAHALSRQLHGDLDAIVLRCLRKSPSDRYRTVSDLDADLVRHLEQQPILARRGDRLYRLERFVARHRVPVFMSLLLLLALLTGTVVLALQSAELARQRNLALIERDHAQQVVQVLRDAFQYADPARAAGDEVSARQILDAARPRLDPLQDTQPHLFAALADTLASVELALAADTQAAELAQRGLAAAESSTMVDQALIRRLRITAARSLAGLGDLESAQLLLQAVRDSDPQPQPDWAVASARLRFNEGDDLTQSINLLRSFLAEQKQADPNDETATEVRWQLADLLRVVNQPDDAMVVLDETLAWQRSGLPVIHPRIALTQLRRMGVRASLGDPGASLQDANTIVAQLLDQYGTNSSMAGMAHYTLSSILRSAGQPNEAIEQLRLAYAAWRASLGEDHATTLRVGLNLSRALFERSQVETEAVALLSTTLIRAENRFGANSQLTTRIRINLAQMLTAQARPLDAVQLLTGAVDSQTKDRLHPLNLQLLSSALSEAMTGAGCLEGENQEIRAACAEAQALLDDLLSP